MSTSTLPQTKPASRPAPAKKSHLALFFALTIPLGWAFWIPMILINHGIWTPPLPVPTLVWSSLGAVSPLVALWIVQRVSRGQVRLADIFRNIRLREFRSPWTLASPFVILGIYLGLVVVYLGVETIRGGTLPAALVFDPTVWAELGGWILPVVLIQFAASLITSPLFEEPGWRGFAFENLQRYLPRDLASLVVGSYWWLWHQGMNVAFAQWPTGYGYLAMLLDSVAIDALYTLSGGNILAAMLAHQAMGTAFTFLAPLPEAWYLLGAKVVAVGVLRYLVHRRRGIGVTERVEEH